LAALLIGEIESMNSRSFSSEPYSEARRIRR